MEDNLNFFLNGRRPQIFEKWKTTSNFGKWKTISNLKKWKTTSNLKKMEDYLEFFKSGKNKKNSKWKTTSIFKVNGRRSLFQGEWKTTLN